MEVNGLRLIGLRVVLVLAMALRAGPALAQAAATRVLVTVGDVTAKRPLALARVTLVGPESAIGYSDERGVAVFDDLRPGRYRVAVLKVGFAASGDITVAVVERQQVAVDIALSHTDTATKVIGSVRTRTSPLQSVDTVAADSGLGRISDRLSDALAANPNITLGADGRSFSIAGADPSQTSLTVDGVPAGGLGLAGDTRLLNPDLFASATVHTEAAHGGSAGSIDFHSLEPTVAFQSAFTAGSGSYGDSSLSVFARGTAGSLGYVVNNVVRGANGPLDARYYADASGVGPYDHRAGAFSSGTLLKLRTTTRSGATVGATLIGTNSNADTICDRLPSLVPCGFGPGNALHTRLTSLSMSVAAQAGDVTLSFLPYAQRSTIDSDLGNRYLLGVPEPSATALRSSSAGFVFSASASAGLRHLFVLGAEAYRTSLAEMSVNTVARLDTGSSTAYTRLDLSDTVRLSSRLRLVAKTGVARAWPVTQFSPFGELLANWHPDDRNQLSASYATGLIGAGFASALVLADPQSLQFNCQAHAALGSGPGDAGGAQDTSKLRFTWQHRGRTDLIAVSAFQTIEHGGLLFETVPGTELPTGYLSPGYLQVASSLYGSSAECGTPSSLGRNDLYFSRLVSVPRLVYRGLTASGAFSVGRSLTVVPSYALTSATPSGGGALRSTLIEGSQLPNLPVQRGNLLLDYRRPSAIYEGILDFAYTGANNGFNLPAFTTVSAGLSRTLPHGAALTVALRNVFNVHGDPFSTPTGAVGLPLAGGGTVPVYGQPLAPRQIQVVLTMRAGMPDRHIGVAAGDLLASAPSDVQRFDIRTLPAIPPLQPFAVDAANSGCTPDAYRYVTSFMQALEPFVAAVRARGASSSGYPLDPPLPLPVLEGARVAYHSDRTRFFLAFTFDRMRFAAFARCAAFAIAEPDALVRGLVYARSDVAPGQPDIQFTPAYGFYLVAHEITKGGGTTAMGLPPARPSAPLELKPNPPCTAASQPIARAVASAIGADLARGDPLKHGPYTANGIVLVPHGASMGWWLELRLDDPVASGALRACLPVSEADDSEIRRRGYDAVDPPALNFTPELGVYVRRRPG